MNDVSEDNYRAVRSLVARGLALDEIRRLTRLPIPELRALIERAKRDVAKQARRRFPG